MESIIVNALASNAPMVLLVAFGFWRVLVALHKIEIRLIRVDTKIEIEEPKHV
jgi:hypothetical protein